MAKKSKTQRAKASAARAARKEQALEAEAAAAEAKDIAEANETEAPKKKFFKRAEKSEASADDSKQMKASSKSVEKKAEKKPAKKRRFGFLKDVRSELRRVTWPTKQDVLRWSVVVVVALVFFGVYVAALDNVIITPLLIAISGLGA